MSSTDLASSTTGNATQLAAHEPSADETGWSPAVAPEVCFLVFNSFRRDARVLREGKTLVAAGCRVTVLATYDKQGPQDEELDGLRVIRLALRPLHQRVFSAPPKTAATPVDPDTKASPSSDRPATPPPPARAPTPSTARRILVRFWRRRFGKPPPTPWKQLRRQIKLRLVAPAGRLRRKLARALRLKARDAARFVLLPFARQLRFFDYYQRAVAVMRGQRCAVVHAHDLNTLPAGWWLARRHRARLIYDSHELYLDRNRRPRRTWLNRLLTRELERFLIRRCDAVITVNDSLANLLAQRYRIARPLVLRNTPSRNSAPATSTVKSPSLRDLVPIEPSHLLLLYCGFITFNRGLPNLIRSLHHLPDCHLVLMGFGTESYLAELDELVTAEGLAARYSRLGPVPPEEVTSYAASADLGVAPIESAGLSYYYCAPNKLFEYLHAGLPVIASDFPELRAVIDEHRVGATFDPTDPRDIARAARAVMDTDSGDLQRLRMRTKEAALLYCWELESPKLLSVYGELTGGATGSHTDISPAPRLAQVK
jgi:glycosyltransferase involved in cell wall biosynthesis